MQMFRYRGTTIPLCDDIFFTNCKKQIIYRICGITQYNID